MKQHSIWHCFPQTPIFACTTSSGREQPARLTLTPAFTRQPCFSPLASMYAEGANNVRLLQRELKPGHKHRPKSWLPRDRCSIFPPLFFPNVFCTMKKKCMNLCCSLHLNTLVTAKLFSTICTGCLFACPSMCTYCVAKFPLSSGVFLLSPAVWHCPVKG